MSTRSIVPPEIPPEARVDEVYEAMKIGLQFFLRVYQTNLDKINDEINKSKMNSRLESVYEFDQQAKVIETYIGCLEVHYVKTEQIYEAYREKRKLRDEANKVIKECKSTPGTKEAKDSLVKANNDFKKYSEGMTTKEKELQKQLGEFSIKMKGIAGFARLCAGDQYEILIKYGRQRWKMHGSIEVNAKQLWDSEQMTFFPMIHEFISVKVTEIKSVTNHVVVGNIFCEPKDLFAPLSRTVAVDINEFGTLKLVLEVTWNCVQDPTPGPVSGPVPSPRPSPGSPPVSHSPSPSRGSQSSGSSEPVRLPTLRPLQLQQDRPPSQIDQHLQPVEPPARVKAKCWPRDGVLVDTGLQDALQILISSLDEYTRHLSDLRILEDELKLLQGALKGCRNGPPPSRQSQTHKAAGNHSKFIDEDPYLQPSPVNTPPQGRGRDRTSTPLTTGCTRLDRSLVLHLRSCSTQLVHLGVSGPLQCRATYALDKLLREARVFKTIRHIIGDDPHHLKHPTEVIPELDQSVGAGSLWEQCVGDDCLYCVSTKTFMNTLSTLYSSMLSDRADTVLSCLVERVLEQKFPQRGFRGESVITLFQLWSYLESNGIGDMEFHIIALTEEVELIQNLLSKDQGVIIETLHLPSECSLKREGIQTVAKLLTDPREKVLASASSVLRILAGQHKQREQALVNCLEMLEDEDVDTRVCGCKALACLKATESIEQLMYLCQTDGQDVQEAAMQTLLELGDEGKMALRRLGISQDIILDPEPWSDRSSTSTYVHPSSSEY